MSTTKTTKYCPRCEQEKNTRDFGKDKGSPDGLNYYCKPCRRALSKASRGTPMTFEPPYLELLGVKPCRKCLRLLPPEKFGKDSRSKDGMNIYCCECRATLNSFRRSEISPRITYPNYIVYFGKQPCIKCLEFKTAEQFVEDNRYSNGLQNICNECSMERLRERRARKAGCKGDFSEKEWGKLKEFYKHKCLACGIYEDDIAPGPLGQKLTRDHVTPLSKGGSNTIDNIQPLCWMCNSTKNAKTIDYRTAHKPHPQQLPLFDEKDSEL